MKSTNAGLDSIAEAINNIDQPDENNTNSRNVSCHTVTSVTRQIMNFDFPRKCYRCELSDFKSKREYEIHCITKHPGKPGFPGLVDIEKDGLKPQNMRWEI